MTFKLINNMSRFGYKRHGLMLNACQVKLNIGIELYRTTKHENAKRVVFF